MTRPKPEPGASAPASRWRTLFEKIAPNRGFHTPRPGEEILVHWLSLLPLGSRGVLPALSWRVHKANKRGIGRGRHISTLGAGETLSNLADHVDLEIMNEAVKGYKAANLHVPRQVSAIDPKNADRLLRALSGARYVYWEETGERVSFEPVPVTPRISAVEQGDGSLALSGDWLLPDQRLFRPARPRIVAGPWPWLEDAGILRPVFGAGDGTALAIFMESGAVVSTGEVPAFLGSAVGLLQSRGAVVKIDSGREIEHENNDGRPLPRLYLAEEGKTLSANLRFLYGDIEIPAENPDPVLLLEMGGGKVRVTRDMDAEFEAVSTLRTHGFHLSDPGVFEIEGEAALDFVRLRLPGLAGVWEVFGQEAIKRHKVRTQALTLNVRAQAGEDWLDLWADAAVGTDQVEIEKILRALKRGSRYVRLGDGANAVIPEEWASKLGALLEETGLEGGESRLPNYMLPVVEELLAQAEEPQVLKPARYKKLAERLANLPGGKSEPIPSTLNCTLRPYQTKGYTWLRKMEKAGFGAVLADDMGLGKTIQALALLARQKEEGGRGPSLVVAPTSVVYNWEQEIARHAPTLKTHLHHGGERFRHLADFAGKDVILTSYAILRRDVDELAGVDFNYVILDEAQAIKNAATQTARAVHKLKARRRLALTGTLLENHLGELWSHFNFLLPGLLGSQRQFVTRFERPIVKGDEEAATNLRNRIRPFILRRMKGEVAPELPPKVENVLWSEFTPEQAELYAKLLAAGRERVMRAVEEKGVGGARACILDVLLRLRQVCCHPKVLPGNLGMGVGSAKYDQFCDFTTEVIEEGNRVLVYSQFVKVLKILKGFFEKKGIKHLYMDGASRDREETVRRFQEDATIPVFLISLKAGGTGLNLTGADYVILFDPWWNPAVEAQAADRAHRIGRERAVFFYRMVAKGTVEEKIRKLQERKKAVADEFIRSEHQWGLPTTKEELLELFDY